MHAWTVLDAAAPARSKRLAGCLAGWLTCLLLDDERLVGAV